MRLQKGFCISFLLFLCLFSGVSWAQSVELVLNPNPVTELGNLRVSLQSDTPLEKAWVVIYGNSKKDNVYWNR